MTSPAKTMNQRLRQVGALAALACVLLSGGVFLRRGVASWRAAHVAPGTVFTSGCEEESIFALWRAAHGQPVLTDLARFPYTHAYFNWLFYEAYAQPTKAAVSSGGGGAIVVVDRLVSAAGLLVGAVLLFWLIRRARPESPLLAAAVSGFVFFGSLVGWWAFTVRPDAWALTWETAGIVVLIWGYQKRPRLVTVAAALLFYAAWAFKQTYVTGLGGAFLFLLVRRRWKLAGILTATSVVLWIATFALGGALYRAAIAEGIGAANFRLWLGRTNFVEMMTKTFPLWILGGFAIMRRPEEPTTDLQRDMRLFGAVGFAVAMPLALISSCKDGAGSNYYFTTTVMLAVASAAVTTRQRAGALVVPTAIGLAAVIQLMVVAGRVGTIDLAGQVREHASTWAVWQKEPEPRYAARTVLNQPWLNPGSPPVVLACTYWFLRQAGRTFEGGGLGKLVASGFFRSLLLPDETGTEYDEGSLARYTRGESINGVTVFRRKDDN